MIAQAKVPLGTNHEFFRRKDSKREVNNLFYSWSYTSLPVVKFTLESTGFGDGDAGHGGKCTITLENEGGYAFETEAVEDKLKFTVYGQCELEILRDFFHQAAQALDEIAAKSDCHEERLLDKPFKA